MNNKLLALSILTLVCFSIVFINCAETAEPAADEMAVQEEPEKPEPGEMVLIPAGEFVMGTAETRTPPIEVPEQKVNLPAYYIDVYEVTYGEWMKFTTESDYTPEGNWRMFYSIGKEFFPVTNVTWDDAKAYCEWAGKRLPTEAEWEKAARGAEGLPYPWGDKSDPTKANCNELGHRNTIEVGQIDTDKSPYGVYDLMGNAQEWTADKLGPYPGSPARGHEVFRSGYMAVRGGSYALKCGSMALYTRSGYLPKAQYGIGFRCAKDAEQPAAPAAAQQP